MWSTLYGATQNIQKRMAHELINLQKSTLCLEKYMFRWYDKHNSLFYLTFIHICVHATLKLNITNLWLL